jgi:hypothetical protein
LKYLGLESVIKIIIKFKSQRHNKAPSEHREGPLGEIGGKTGK